jgi:hypothetical protein
MNEILTPRPALRVLRGNGKPAPTWAEIARRPRSSAWVAALADPALCPTRRRVLAALDKFQVLALVQPQIALIVAGMIENYCHEVWADAVESSDDPDGEGA